MSSLLTKTRLMLCLLTAAVVPALAAEEGRINRSEPIVWVFLGLCALIVIAQLAPMFFNLKKQSKAASEQSQAIKHEQR